MEAISVDQQDQQSFDTIFASIQRESWTRQQLEDYQVRALHACRAYAYAHSPFYQRYHRGLMDRPLQDLPVVTKAMFREHFDDLVTDRAIRLHEAEQYLARADASTLFLDRYQASETSGTTGHAGIFLTDRVEGASVANSFTRSLLWGGATPKSRAAVVTSTGPAHLSSQAPIIIKGQQATRLQLSADEPVETLVQRLNEWQPDVLLWYPSIASVLANEQRQGRLHIAPHLIGCAAETLTSDTRRRIEETWQIKLFQAYGTTESGLLAAECSFHQGLHLFEDFSIVEVVDQDNRPVPPGEQGDKVLITVLFRRTQPLIRYEVTDLVRTSTLECCPCGRPFALIEAIEGRAPEVLYLPSPTGGEESVNPFLFEFIIDTLPVSGWQVIQEHDGLHIFLTGASEELRDEQLLDPLRQALIRQGVLVPAIAIHRVTALTRNASGKAPRVLSHVPHHVS